MLCKIWPKHVILMSKHLYLKFYDNFMKRKKWRQRQQKINKLSTQTKLNPLLFCWKKRDWMTTDYERLCLALVVFFHSYFNAFCLSKPKRWKTECCAHRKQTEINFETTFWQLHWHWWCCQESSQAKRKFILLADWRTARFFAVTQNKYEIFTIAYKFMGN